MKRSDVVKALCKRALLGVGYDATFLSPTEAERILSLLEKLGMAPPSIGMSGTDGYGNPTHIHEWEAE